MSTIAATNQTQHLCAERLHILMEMYVWKCMHVMNALKPLKIHLYQFDNKNDHLKVSLKVQKLSSSISCCFYCF